MNFELSLNGKHTQNPSWQEVHDSLEALKNSEEAYLRLSKEPYPETGALGLSVETDEGYYLPVMLTEDKASGIRELYDESQAGQDPVYIRGYNYDPTTVTRDFELIARIVKEFYETGDVSKDILV